MQFIAARGRIPRSARKANLLSSPPANTARTAACPSSSTLTSLYKCFSSAFCTALKTHTAEAAMMLLGSALLRYFVLPLLLVVLLLDVPTAHARKKRRHRVKVEIMVYYECMCPYSINFITTQLWPTYSQLGLYMKVRLFPFGNGVKRDKTDPNGSKVTEIQCQHGDNECKGNTVQCCVLDQYKESVVQLGFVACMMSSTVPYKAGQKCANQMGISWKLIEKCSSGDYGKALLLEMGKRTWSAEPKVSYVPHIVINGVHNNTVSSRARTNLFFFICELLQPRVPKPCKHYSSKAE